MIVVSKIPLSLEIIISLATAKARVSGNDDSAVTPEKMIGRTLKVVGDDE